VTSPCRTRRSRSRPARFAITARSPSPERAAQVANAAPKALQAFIRQSSTKADRVITVERASVPANPAFPRLKLNLALALLLGLIFNGALALLIEVLGDRVHDADEVERLTGQPILTTVPNLHFRRNPLLAEPEQGGEQASPQPHKVFGRATGG
jgi:capsular polysaccharide biosynthesis protein